MAQFYVYKNENNETNDSVPYLLDVQSDVLQSLDTRVVIPLSKTDKIYKGLTKEFIVNGETVYLLSTQIGTVLATELKTEICSLGKQKEEIENSLDFLIYGF